MKNEIGRNIFKRTTYIGATARLIEVLYREQSVFGVISPKSKRRIVTTAVAIKTPYSSGRFISFAIETLITVASAAAPVFTILFPIRIVINNLSVSHFIFSSDWAPNLFSRTRDWMACFDSVISAISVPEKKADRRIRKPKIIIDKGSTENKDYK